MKKARYPHDCKHCIYIGQINSLDAYYCPDNMHGTCYVLRSGKRGHEYTSRTDYADEEYNKIVQEIAFADSFTKEYVEIDRRRRVLLRILSGAIADYM